MVNTELDEITILQHINEHEVNEYGEPNNLNLDKLCKRAMARTNNVFYMKCICSNSNMSMKFSVLMFEQQKTLRNMLPNEVLNFCDVDHKKHIAQFSSSDLIPEAINLCLHEHYTISSGYNCLYYSYLTHALQDPCVDIFFVSATISNILCIHQNNEHGIVVNERVVSKCNEYIDFLIDKINSEHHLQDSITIKIIQSLGLIMSRNNKIYIDVFRVFKNIVENSNTMLKMIVANEINRIFCERFNNDEMHRKIISVLEY
jgi:hypothetical protein